MAPPLPLTVVQEGKMQAAMKRLPLEDLTRTCRRDRYCVNCAYAFCSHCCGEHHTWPPSCHLVVPVTVDAATGRPTFPNPRNAEGWRLIPRSVADAVRAHDYDTRLPIDAYCVSCQVGFSAASCHHHHDHRRDGDDDPIPDDAVLRIEEGGLVRSTGSEWWLPYLESVLGDPVVREVVDERGEYYELLPVLTRAPGRCAHCGGHVPFKFSFHCSKACYDSYNGEVAERRRRREVRLAARGIAKLQVD